MAQWHLMVLAAIMAATPAAGYAQADPGGDAASQTASEAPGPTLDCTGVGLRIMAAEISGARFACHIAGAPVGDSSFTVRAASTGDENRVLVPLCTGNLAGGTGACTGSFIDRAASGLGQVSLAVTLQPSGATLGPLVIGPSTPAPEPMQFFPLAD